MFEESREKAARRAAQNQRDWEDFIDNASLPVLVLLFIFLLSVGVGAYLFFKSYGML